MTPEEKRKKDREYYAAHRAERLAYQHEYRKQHPEKYAAACRRYRQNKRKKELAATQEYEDEKEYRKQYMKDYRARKKREKQLATPDGFFKPKKESPVVNGSSFRLDECPMCGSKDIGRLTRFSYFCRNCLREINSHAIYKYTVKGLKVLDDDC